MKLGLYIIGTICAQVVTDASETSDNAEYYDDDYYYDDYYNDTDYYYYEDYESDADVAGSIMARSGLNGANGNRPARPNRVKKPRPSKPPRTRPSRPPRTKRPKKITTTSTTTSTTTTTTEEPTTTTTTTTTITTTTTTSTSTTTTTTTSSSSAFDLDYEALKLEVASLDLALEAPASGSKNNYAVDANYINNNQQNHQQYQQQSSQQYQQNSQQNDNQGYNSFDQPSLSCWTCQASSYEECGQTGKLVACQPNQGSCFLEIRDRRDRYQQPYRQIQMGCKAVDACKNMHASNFRNGNPDYTECRPEAHYNHSVCRQCCYEDNCTKSPSWWEPTSREEWAYE